MQVAASILLYIWKQLKAISIEKMFVDISIFFRENILITIIFHRYLDQNTPQQIEYYSHQQNGPSREILYSVKDVSPVEQGRGGFIYAVASNNCNSGKWTNYLEY